jgi:hypothetical protein
LPGEHFKNGTSVNQRGAEGGMSLTMRGIRTIMREKSAVGPGCGIAVIEMYPAS